MALVLVVTGIVELHDPPPNEVLLPWLQTLHPTLWWGVLLTVFGGVLFGPVSSRQELSDLRRCGPMCRAAT